MSKKHLILSQHQCDLPLHLPVCHLPDHHYTSVLSSENERKQKELCPKYVNNRLGFSIPEHMVWHSELNYQIFLNDLHTAMPLDSLLHFGIQLINIRC